MSFTFYNENNRTPSKCINCGDELNAFFDDDPNGDHNCVCARCRAEDKHDFDREPNVKFDRRGHRIEVINNKKNTGKMYILIKDDRSL